METTWEADEAARKAARDERAAQEAVAEAEQVVAQQAAATLATPAQIGYIMDLLAQGRGQEGGFMAGPTSREAVGRMTRQQASAYITSLKGDY